MSHIIFILIHIKYEFQVFSNCYNGCTCRHFSAYICLEFAVKLLPVKLAHQFVYQVVFVLFVVFDVNVVYYLSSMEIIFNGFDKSVIVDYISVIVDYMFANALLTCFLIVTGLNADGYVIFGRKFKYNYEKR